MLSGPGKDTEILTHLCQRPGSAGGNILGLDFNKIDSNYSRQENYQNKLPAYKVVLGAHVEGSLEECK